MMTQLVPKSRAPKWQWKKREFQRKWPNKQRYNGKPKYACYHCGRFGHIRINCPNYNNNNNKNNESK